MVTKTATDFNLEEINGRITADNGETYLPKLADMKNSEVNGLIIDIENHLDILLTNEDIHDLKDVLK